MLLIVRMWTSLIGSRVFAGLDVFHLFSPWSAEPGVKPPVSSIYISDQLDSSIPAMHEIAQRLSHGDLAAWSSSVAGGSSLLGTPVFGVISPGRWLYLIMPAWLAPGWVKLAEMAFAAIFAYLLVRRLNGSKVAGGLAAFVYPMTGFMIAWTGWPQVAVACVIPMMFWSIERFVQERRLVAAVPVAIAAALLIFGGFPAVAGQTLYLAGAYAVVRVVSVHGRARPAIARDLAALGAAVGLGIGLTAFQLLPFASQVLHDVDLSYRDAGFFSTSPIHYLESSVFPESFEGNALWVGASPMDINTYVGSVVLLLAIFGVIQALTGRIRATAGLFYVAAIVFVLVLTYFQGFWSDWMDHLPVFHGNPIGRLRSQLGVPVAVLAAFGLDWLREERRTPGWTERLRPKWGAFTVTVIGLVTLGVGLAGLKMAYGGHFGLSKSVKQDALITCVPLLVITALAALGWRWRQARVATMVIAIIAVGVQAIAATNFYWPTGNRSDFYASAGAITYLQKNLGHDRIGTLGYAIRPNITSYYGLRTLNGHAFTPKQMKDLLLAIDPSAFQGGPTYSLFTPVASNVINTPGLGRLGVRYMVGDVDAVVPGTTRNPLALIGAADPLPASAAAKPLTAGTAVSVPLSGGALRGVDIPMTTTAVSTLVSVVLKTADGSVIARDSRHVEAGTFTVPVPLAAEPAAGEAAVPTSELSAEVTVDQPGVTATADPAGGLRLAAVRPLSVGNTVRMVYASDGVVIWQRLDYVSRIHWASTASVITDDAARLKAVAQSPLARRSVILAADPPEPAPDGDDDPVSFDVVEDSGDNIKVAVDVKSPGFVVVSDNVQQDFDADVDGRSAPILAADYAVGAVYVTAGKHEITLSYAPNGRRNGTYLSVASALVLLLVATSPWWVRRLPGRRSSGRDDRAVS